MSDDRINQIIAVLGGAMTIAAHTIITGPWAQFVGEVGALITGQALLPRKGDVAINTLPKEYQDSVRPSRVP
jgi:hypothetical protein